MTKRDFELIARTINEHARGIWSDRKAFAERMAEALASANPRFDR